MRILVDWQQVRLRLNELILLFQAQPPCRTSSWGNLRGKIERSVENALRQGTESPDVLCEHVEKTLKSFIALSRLGCRFDAIRGQYVGQSQRRLSAIAAIEAHVGECFEEFAINMAPKACLEKLNARLTLLYREIFRDHKAHGALRFFGPLQPNSRLCQLLAPNVQHVRRMLSRS